MSRILNLSKRSWLMACILVVSLTGVASARNGGPTWNRGSGSQAAGSSFAKAQRGMVGSLRAATRQYGEVRGNNGQLRQRADGNMRQAIQSKVGMLKAQQRGLDAKKEAAFSKAQALEKAGDKAGAQAYLNTAISYEARGRGISARINKLSDPTYQSRLINRFGKMKSATVGAQQSSGSTSGVGSAASAAMGRPGKAGKAAKAASFTYNGARKAYVGYQAEGRAAAQRYRQTGDPAALQQMRVSAVNRLQTKALMYKAQVQGLRSKAAAAAGAGNPEKAASYTAKADKLQTRAQRLSGVADRFESKLQAGTLKTPRRMVANQAADGPAADGPEMDFGGNGPAAQQATDSEGAPGVDAQQQAAVRGIASYKGKTLAMDQMGRGNILGALGTLKQMEAQANRRGPMGLVDRYRKWSTKRAVLKDAYSMGKKAARSGDLERAQGALQAVTTLGKPGWRTNWKVRAIANKALSGAKAAAKDRDPQQAVALLDFARQVQMSMDRKRPTWRFLRIRNTARSRAWSDMKRQAKEGNLEAFRATQSLILGFSKDSDGKKLTKKEGREIGRLYQVATKQSVVRALDDAKMLLSGKMGYVNVEEGAKRLAYAEQTAEKLAQRGISIKTRSFLIFRKSLNGRFKNVRKMLVKGFQDQNRVEPGKPSLFARWWKMGGGQGGPNIAPVPRTPAEVAEGRRLERMQQEIVKMAESGELTQEKLQQYPPELLQHMGLM